MAEGGESGEAPRPIWVRVPLPEGYPQRPLAHTHPREPRCSPLQTGLVAEEVGSNIEKRMSYGTTCGVCSPDRGWVLWMCVLHRCLENGRVAGRDPSSLQRWIVAITSSASRSPQLPKVAFIFSHFSLVFTIGVRSATGLLSRNNARGVFVASTSSTRSSSSGILLISMGVRVLLIVPGLYHTFPPVDNHLLSTQLCP
jgi:hypothetical protein